MKYKIGNFHDSILSSLKNMIKNKIHHRQVITRMTKNGPPNGSRIFPTKEK